MSARLTLYWLACSVFAAMAVQAAEPTMVDPALFVLPQAEASLVLPVPEPGRALLLFAGIMAMAFTYRRVWVNWKRGS